MISTSPLSIRTPTTFYRGYTYFWHENAIKLPLRGEATKHFANEEEAKAYINSRKSKTQETEPSSAVAPGVMSGPVANWIGGLPAWLIGLFGLVFSFLIVSLFLFSSSPNPHVPLQQYRARLREHPARRLCKVRATTVKTFQAGTRRRRGQHPFIRRRGSASGCRRNKSYGSRAAGASSSAPSQQRPPLSRAQQTQQRGRDT